MAKFMKAFYGLYEYNLQSESLLNNIDFEYVNDKLLTDGYFIYKIDSGLCDEIINNLSNVMFIDRKTNNKIKFKDFKKNTNFGNTYWVNNMSDILSIKSVQKLASDEKILKIAQDFLGCKPLLVQVNLWKSSNNSNNKKDYSQSAQLFHRDFGNEKWLKVFVYLNDVGINNGPHCFVRGSQNKIINNDVKRETDKFIKENFSKDDICYFSGEKGTIIFENTRGYHKGCSVIKGTRLIIQLEFAINPCQYYKFNIRKCSKKLENMIKLYPDVYKQIKLIK